MRISQKRSVFLIENLENKKVCLSPVFPYDFPVSSLVMRHIHWGDLALETRFGVARVSKNTIPKTSLGLLEQLQCEQFDQVAWDRFVSRYESVLVNWARRWGAQGADCQELAQEVLLKLVRSMRNFRYDPNLSFRSWLKTVAYRALKRQNEKFYRLRLLGESHTSTLLNSIEARGELHSILESQAERELLELSAERVRNRVHEKTWRAFELMVIHEFTGEQVANELGISVSSVYVAKFNVMRMLRDEAAVLGET